MAIILIKLPRVTDVDGREVRLGDFEKHHIKNTSKSFSDKRMTIPAEELQKPPHFFKQGKETYLTLDADFLDDYKQLRRYAQIILLKDIGRIMTLLGVTKDSKIVEAGSGSGAATCYLAKVAKEVHSYDVEVEHLAFAKENVKDLGCDNVSFYNEDVYDVNKVEQHEADGFLLDVPDPVKALPSVMKALRLGGRCVIYTPQISQAQEVVTNLPKELLYEQTIELNERMWDVKPRVLRPRIQGTGHTAFLTLVRKIPKNE